MTAAEDRALRRRFRKVDFSREEQTFLRILSTLGLATWMAIVWVKAFPLATLPERTEEPVRIAQVLIKPPPPPEEKKEEPKPEPLPPAKAEVKKPGPKPVQVAAAPKASKPRPPGAQDKQPKRSVASMGLLSLLSSNAPRTESSSQRIGEVLRNVDFKEAQDLSEDMGSLTGTVGAREKASVAEMVAGLPRGTGTQVELKGSVVTPIGGPAGPRVSSAGGDGSGTSARTLAEIRQIVASYLPGLKYLYDRELKQRPSLHGKVTVEFVVTGAGTVADVRLVNSALGHPSLESAILSRIRNWRFPAKAGDSTKVTFPFDFLAPTV